MQLSTLDVDRDQAESRLMEYRVMLDSERTAEDSRIMAGYRAIARGLPVISLSRTVHAGGYFANGLPRIAVVRSDAINCWVYTEEYRRQGEQSIVFTGESDVDNRGALVGRDSVRVNVPFDHDRSRGPSSWSRGRTIVPVIPPAHRPRRNRLHLFHVLWEVESWTRVPPKDPALLKWIGGDLWAVVATWDLTELERAVLAGRAA
jgi:hypothetical protein